MRLLKSSDLVSTLALAVANLIPLIGVLLAGWDASSIVLLYWTENLILGFYNVLKMTFAKAEEPIHHLSKLFLIPFFCLHYGGFCGVHGVFLLFFFKLGVDAHSILPDEVWWGPLVFLQILVHVVTQLWQSAPRGMLWAFVGLVASHGISFVRNYFLRGEYRKLSVQVLMNRPYKRIFVLHVAIIAGGFLVMALQSPLSLLIMLVALKICLDIYLHHRSHRHESHGESKGHIG